MAPFVVIFTFTLLEIYFRLFYVCSLVKIITLIYICLENVHTRCFSYLVLMVINLAYYPDGNRASVSTELKSDILEDFFLMFKKHTNI